MLPDAVHPITVYGSSISYFTGKLENYFRIKGIPYQLRALTVQEQSRVVTNARSGTRRRTLVE